ncbi:MAG: cob(I)yrinic acid a,c-diamide adenosyltransferase [Gammaproteobacteria bacterium]|nr:cob(I)yrinic acid a,c-diamide adenosyltransferase [Gammaproteobacteria bacterium]MBU1414712.1 cob(I)yrinic acid a,c-diamide adenosyltransferase [Gammaproteobacteria bacterium]
MANRLTNITTRTGDAGTTGLADGSRLGKDAPRIAALGEIDELNSLLGAILCEEMPAEVRELLVDIQHDLLDLGGELAVPGATFLKKTQLTRIEVAVERYNGELSPLKEFILPGGTRAAALAHLARTVCRRAERTLVALGHFEPVSEVARKYLNRLSDLLFVLGRWLNKSAGGGDVLWQKGRNA